jgi:hypothetical protein
MQGMITTSTCSIAELAGNEPTLHLMEVTFPVLDTAVVESIHRNKFQAANLLILKALFTDKMNHPQFYSFGMGENSLNLSMTCNDVDLKK